MAPQSSSWSPQRAKIQLKLSIQRIRLLAAKKQQLNKVSRREIAAALEKGKIETARIKVEGVMGEDTMVDLLEVLELYCELLLARFGILETVREVDPGVAEAVTGIVYAASRTELKELHILREMLMNKYGRDFALSVMENKDEMVPARITNKLAISAPPAALVDNYLHIIAQSYNVDWAPEGYVDPSTTTPSSTAVPTALDASSSDTSAPVPTPQSPAKHPASLDTFPDTPPVEPANAANTVILHTNLPSPGVKAPAAPVVAAAPKVSQKKAEDDAFEALSKRFAELKKR